MRSILTLYEFTRHYRIGKNGNKMAPKIKLPGVLLKHAEMLRRAIMLKAVNQAIGLVARFWRLEQQQSVEITG